MTRRDDLRGTAVGLNPLRKRALAREAARARHLLTAGEWRPAPSDSAAAAVLARLAAPLPTRRAATREVPNRPG
ncbi:hypothetical protein [Streptomyces sp. NBC_01216]|uniref:hypothetical protein n=1 Tax=unclassified Streptomyces TaxID=2593676 RepID=UPI002E13A566|nr:hypothetical protein OG393_01440 [Streptomyces sp. NBC_01216]